MRRFLFVSSLLIVGILLALPLTGALAQGASGEAKLTGGLGGPGITQSGNFFSGLTGVYRLGLSLVGLSALFMIVWGGLNYIWAGENTSQVQRGRERIRNALVGILIAATSYALLKTINPDLIKPQIDLSNIKQLQKQAPESGYQPTIRDPRFERGPVEVRNQNDIGTAPTGRVSNLSQCQGAAVFDQRCSDACRNSGGQYVQQLGVGGVGYRYGCQR